MMIIPLWEQTGAAERVMEKSMRLAETDPHGVVTAFVGISVVFASLLFLFIMYSVVGQMFASDKSAKAFKTLFRPNIKKPGAETGVTQEEEIAAIAMAVHMYIKEQTPHDHESGVITIKNKN